MDHWRETRIDDLEKLTLQIMQIDQRIDLVDEDTPRNRMLLHNNCRTWEHESGKVLTVMGVWPLWDGVGHAWAFFSAEAIRRPVALCRAVRGFLHEIIERDGLWRVQTTVEQGYYPARRFLIRLGFKFEGVLKAYGPTGKDQDMYALVRLR